MDQDIKFKNYIMMGLKMEVGGEKMADAFFYVGSVSNRFSLQTD